MTDTILDVQDLRKYFPVKKGFFRRHVGDVKAVDGVSFTVDRGETLGLVGESGCGKTTTGRSVLRAIEPTSGSIRFFENGKDPVDVTQLTKAGMRHLRQKMQMIFQDPYASLNPRMTVEEIVKEPLFCFGVGTARERRERVGELLQVVGLDPKYMSRYPHTFSGGQRQRIGIARALALHPDLIVADEAVSALDVSVQAQVLNLILELQNQFHLTYIFIAHDIGVVDHICDRVAVMYIGKMVEVAGTKSLFRSPKHPYTEALLSAVPRPNPHYELKRMVLEGEVVDPAHRPSGCAFHPRCRYADGLCAAETPAMETVPQEDSRGSHAVACHHFKELQLKGVFR